MSLKVHAGPEGKITGKLSILCFKIKDFFNADTEEKDETKDIEIANTPYDDSVFINAEKESETSVADRVEKKPETAFIKAEESEDTHKGKTVEFKERKKTDIFQKIRRAYELFDEESAKKSVRKVLNGVFKILRSVLPRKGKGYITFGTGDPYSTGEIMEVLAFFYPLYGRIVNVTPDFCDKVLSGEISVKGRIYLCRVLFEAALIYFNKSAKLLFKELKEIFT
ncbi:MAG: DUF2953 domain-containing protein [Lachnospiraceae bacterium]|nr:DUF2953 domain-containing protein [Lachnospiraceae bacterium]